MTMNNENSELADKNKGEASDFKRFVMRCATCKYWQGDKEKTIKMFNENPVSMDLYKGWANEGKCVIDDEWLNTEANGDAVVYATVDANFGCIYWGA